LCISGFEDDAIFSYNWLYAGVTLPQQHDCNAMSRPTPLLRDIVGVLS